MVTGTRRSTSFVAGTDGRWRFGLARLGLTLGSAGRLGLVYAMVGALWVYLSDLLLASWVGDPD